MQTRRAVHLFDTAYQSQISRNFHKAMELDFPLNSPFYVWLQSVLILMNKFVSHPGHRLKDEWISGILLDLTAQAIDYVLQHCIVRFIAISPNASCCIKKNASNNKAIIQSRQARNYVTSNNSIQVDVNSQVSVKYDITNIQEPVDNNN